MKTQNKRGRPRHADRPTQMVLWLPTSLLEKIDSRLVVRQSRQNLIRQVLLANFAESKEVGNKGLLSQGDV